MAQADGDRWELCWVGDTVGRWCLRTTNSKEILRADTERVGVVEVTFTVEQAMNAQRGVEV
jgi:hypothetical protein